MAATFSPTDAIVYVQAMLKNQPINLLQSPILQDACSLIWLAAPWSWTLGTTAPILVLAAQQDMTGFALPADFLRFERGLVVDGTAANEVVPATALPSFSGGLQSTPAYFALQTATTIRFNAVMPGQGAGGQRIFTSIYKKIAPDLTNTANTPGALVMDDSYFWVYREVVLYYAYRYADDQRAGSATTVISADGKAQCQYSGQLGVAHAAIEFMRATENLSAGYAYSGNQPPLKTQ